MENKIILIVEDNPDDFALTVRALKKNRINCKLYNARDGEEALDLFFGSGLPGESSGKKPDLVILDLKLPKIGGLELLKQLKQSSETKFIPVVVLSSSLEESDLSECYRLGANSYIRKPVNFDDFLTIISSLSNYWLRMNINPSNN